MNDEKLYPCIVCLENAVVEFLDLGMQALANKFVAADHTDPESRFPLRVGFCTMCGHVQLTERVPPSAMFEDYLYVSSASDVLRAHLYELSDTMVTRCRLNRTDLVIDIGCNDGTLLKAFASAGVRCLGVDPARNLAELNQIPGVERHVGFFNSESAKEIVQRYGKAALITATNTFPHIPALHDFIQGIDTALAPGGSFVIEAHYLLDLIEQCAFDTVYHEHVSYWALGPMMRLFKEHGMQVVNAERLPIHHGQLRATVQRIGEGQVQPSVAKLCEEEYQQGLGNLETYREFAARVEELRDNVRTVVAQLMAEGKRLAAYGAPAKGSTFLDFLGLGPHNIAYVADRSPLKQGRYTPGSHIPIVATEHILRDQPDYLLILAWNFADEIIAQQAEYRARGGRFLMVFPEVRVIEPTAVATA